MFRYYCVLIIFQQCVSSINCESPLIRQTTNGPVEGVDQISSLGLKYYAFKGIPYAEAPITGIDPYTGESVDRRFKAPVALQRRWIDNLKVHAFGNKCKTSMKDFSNGLIMVKESENCLFLNIYVPAGGSTKKTVLIWIHGGAFLDGSGDDNIFGPDFLIDHDNILVTLNYRFGIFGFLNLEFGEYTGNMGFKDQQMALKWIFENIEHFSGNKHEILLFGHSAGGASVNFQMLNEESRKYFNRAFLMSGTALTYFALSEANHMERMQKYSEINDIDKLIEYLKTTDGDTIAKCNFTTKFKHLLISPWTPTIESPKTKGAFITRHPEEIYSYDTNLAMDTLLGFTSQEYITFAIELTQMTKPLLSDDKELKLDLPFDGFYDHPDEYKEALLALKEAYFSDATDENTIKHRNIGLLSDLNFGYSILKTAALQAKINTNDIDRKAHKNTFLLRFSVTAELNIMKLLTEISFDGAAHGEDLGYIFHCHVYDQFKFYDKHLKSKNNTSYNTMERMTKMITNFARTGNPSIFDDTPFKSCTTTDLYCQDINNNRKMSNITNIKEEMRYDTWLTIDHNYKMLKYYSSLISKVPWLRDLKYNPLISNYESYLGYSLH